MALWMLGLGLMGVGAGVTLVNRWIDRAYMERQMSPAWMAQQNYDSGKRGDRL